MKLRTLRRGHCLAHSGVSEFERGEVGPGLLRGGAGCLVLAFGRWGQKKVEGGPVSDVYV